MDQGVEQSAPVEQEKNSDYDLVVDIIRHGQALYTDEEKRTAQYHGKLSERGIEDITLAAKGLVGGIDKEEELVIIWSSPKSRAAESADLISKELQAQGINQFRKVINKEDLRDVNMVPEFNEKKRNFPQMNWMDLWDALEELPEGMESHESVRQRTNKVMSILARITNNYHLPDGKKLHFIIIAHEEIAKTLLDDTLNKVEVPVQNLANAEVMRIGFNKTPEKGIVSVDVQLRDLPIRRVGFSIDGREFIT